MTNNNNDDDNDKDLEPATMTTRTVGKTLVHDRALSPLIQLIAAVVVVVIEMATGYMVRRRFLTGTDAGPHVWGPGYGGLCWTLLSYCTHCAVLCCAVGPKTGNIHRYLTPP